MSVVGASPLNMFDTLTPPSASSPRPSERRASTMAASAGRLATNIRPACLSYQRKAGMPALVPCRRPAWPAGVVEGTRVHHRTASWPPERTQRANVGRSPELRPNRSSGYGSPSICTTTTPAGCAACPSPGVGRPARRTLGPTPPHEIGHEVGAVVDADQPSGDRRDERDDHQRQHRRAQIGDGHGRDHQQRELEQRHLHTRPTRAPRPPRCARPAPAARVGPARPRPPAPRRRGTPSTRAG